MLVNLAIYNNDHSLFSFTGDRTCNKVTIRYFCDIEEDEVMQIFWDYIYKFANVNMCKTEAKKFINTFDNFIILDYRNPFKMYSTERQAKAMMEHAIIIPQKAKSRDALCHKNKISIA